MGLALFELLASSGVNFETLNAADEQELIRLEKRIKATQKLNNNHPQELVVQAIDALRRRKKALLFVLSEPTIQALNKGEHKYLFNAKIDLPEGEELIQLKELFHTLLEADLRELLVALMRKNEWEGLYSWLKLKPVFSMDLVEALQRKLVDHLQGMFNSIGVKEWNAEQRNTYSFIKNTTFYQVMNQLDCAELEATVYRFFEDSKEYYSKGTNINYYEDVFDKLSLYRPDDTRFHQIRKSVKALSILKELDLEPGSGSGSGGSTLKTIGIAVLILFSLIRLARSCDRINSNSRNSNRGTPAQNERQSEQAEKIIYAVYTEFGAMQKKLGSRSAFGTCDSVNSDRSLRLVQPEINPIDTKTGQILKGDLHLKSTNSVRSPVVFVNKTKQDIVAFLIVKGEANPLLADQPYSIAGMSKGAVVIKSGESLEVQSRIIKFFLHSGKALYGYTFNSSGRSQPPHSWAFCPLSSLDSALVRHTFELYKDESGSGGRIEISKNKSSYKIKWTGKEYSLYDLSAKAYLPRNSFHVIDLKPLTQNP